MLDVLIFIASVGPVVNKANLIETVYSISKNIGECNYKFYIVVDNPDNLSTWVHPDGHEEKLPPIPKRFVKEIFDNENLRHIIKKDSLLEVVHTLGPWYQDYNLFFEKYKNDTKHILISHDDIVMHTDNFYNKSLKEIEGVEEQIGWIVYTNDGYHDHPLGPKSNTTGTGFHIDRNEPFLYECHNYELNQTLSEENKHLLDLPKRTTKCYGPFDLMLVSTDSMEIIGPCSNFGPYTMLVDEDWALESLKNNLINVWIPDILITHPNKRNKRNSDYDLRFESDAHKNFHNKWGFYAHRDYDTDFVKKIQREYKNTNIPWSSDRRTYEWDYLKDE